MLFENKYSPPGNHIGAGTAVTDCIGSESALLSDKRQILKHLHIGITKVYEEDIHSKKVHHLVLP